MAAHHEQQARAAQGHDRISRGAGSFLEFDEALARLRHQGMAAGRARRFCKFVSRT